MLVYPVALDLRGRLCVVVGGGAVAERAVDELESCSFLAPTRPEIAACRPDPAGRTAAWYRLIDEVVLAPGTPGDAAAWRERIRAWLAADADTCRK